MRIHRTQLFNEPISYKALELKLSPTLLSVGGLMVPPAVSTVQASTFDDSDPLPEPEPAPPPYPGDNPPIEYPLLPPSGPAGPGSNS
jgi:hypothetical protein